MFNLTNCSFGTGYGEYYTYARGNAREIAEELDIGPELLSRWRREYPSVANTWYTNALLTNDLKVKSSNLEYNKKTN